MLWPESGKCFNFILISVTSVYFMFSLMNRLNLSLKLRFVVGNYRTSVLFNESSSMYFLESKLFFLTNTLYFCFKKLMLYYTLTLITSMAKYDFLQQKDIHFFI